MQDKRIERVRKRETEQEGERKNYKVNGSLNATKGVGWFNNNFFPAFGN